jgi:predicted AlkP superfamily phosphohydrolase/phosphomutase
MPGFGRLMAEGAWGRLRSTLPPVTPAAWMSIATGLRPAKHGVLDFLEVDWQRDRVHLSPVTQRKSGLAIWDILSQYDRRVAVINVPCTYPPDYVNGIMVSGFSTPSQERTFTHPPEFQQELLSLVPEYQIDITKVDQIEGYSKDQLLSLVHKMTDGRIKLLHQILEQDPWDFVFFTMVGSDRLQHPFWEELILGDSAQLIDYYRRLDEVLLQGMDWVGDNGLLFVLSDHGFRGADRWLNINQLQASHGWTILKPRVRLRNGLISLLSKLRLKNVLESIYLSLQLHSQKPPLASERLLGSISVADSKMWALTHVGSAFASLFFSPSVPVTKQEEILAALAAELQKLGVLTPEDVFFGDALFSVLGLSESSRANWRGPQAILMASPPWAFQGRPRPYGIVEATEPVGIHDMEGCLLIWGKEVRAGPFAQPAAVYDIAPTILYALDLPLESDFDGHPLTSLFTLEHQVRVRDKITGAIWEDVETSDSVRGKIDRLLKEAGQLKQ